MRKKIQKPTTKNIKDLEEEIDDLNQIIAGWMNEVESLKKKEIGYRAVISYLENQLGLKDSMT
jgi:ABC-type Zn uptake system ZnuABC Zn-binding protein ZnuA